MSAVSALLCASPSCSAFQETGAFLEGLPAGRLPKDTREHCLCPSPCQESRPLLLTAAQLPAVWPLGVSSPHSPHSSQWGILTCPLPSSPGPTNASTDLRPKPPTALKPCPFPHALPTVSLPVHTALALSTEYPPQCYSVLSAGPSPPGLSAPWEGPCLFCGPAPCLHGPKAPPRTHSIWCWEGPHPAEERQEGAGGDLTLCTPPVRCT